jgi:exopolyphosphatase/guanosine-5'-triphosphate,3'-diphosphate pyrophosphatase
MALSEKERTRVIRLASILRIADALDREHLQTVRDLRTRVTDNAVHLDMNGTGELLLERWAVQKKAGMFESTFSRKLRMRDDGKA